jgi:formamidopyrimidine-DNA glycosylase
MLVLFRDESLMQKSHLWEPAISSHLEMRGNYFWKTQEDEDEEDTQLDISSELDIVSVIWAGG